MARYSAESTPGQKRSYQVWISAGGVIIVGVGVLAAVRVFQGRVTDRPQGPSSALSAQSSCRLPAPLPGLGRQSLVCPRPSPASPLPVRLRLIVGRRAVAEALAILNTNPGRLIEVRDKLSEIVKGPMTVAQSQLVRAQLSPWPTGGCLAPPYIRVTPCVRPTPSSLATNCGSSARGTRCPMRS